MALWPLGHVWLALGHPEIFEIIDFLSALPLGPYLDPYNVHKHDHAWVDKRDPETDLPTYLSAPRVLPFPDGAVRWSVTVTNSADGGRCRNFGIGTSIGDVEGFMAQYDELIALLIKERREENGIRYTPGDYQICAVDLHNWAPRGYFNRYYPLVETEPPALLAHADDRVDYFSLEIGGYTCAFAQLADRVCVAVSRECALVHEKYSYHPRYAFRILVATPGEPTRFARFAVGDTILDELPLGRAVDVIRGRGYSLIVVTDSHAVRLTPIDGITWNVESRRHDLDPTAAYRVGDLILMFRVSGGPLGDLFLYDFDTGEVVSSCKRIYALDRPSVVGDFVYTPLVSEENYLMHRVARVVDRRIDKLEPGGPFLPSPVPHLVDVDGAIGYQDGDRIVLTAPGRPPAHRVPSQAPPEHSKLSYSGGSCGWYAGGFSGAIRIWAAKRADP